MLVRLPRIFAIAFFALFIAAAISCFIAPITQVPVARPGQYTDIKLYRDIVTEMQTGKPYYQAATELQRAHDYPTRPFFTVRQPTLSWMAARIGWDNLQKFAVLLVVVNICVWLSALPEQFSRMERIGALFGIALGSAGIAVQAAMTIADLWCGLLLSLALGLTLAARKHWWLPMLPVAAALAVRELALPFLLLAGTFALYERRWKELAGWSGLFACYAVALIFHASAQLAQVNPGDPASQGWTGMQGLRGVLMALNYTSPWLLVWQPLGLFLCLLPVLGWAALDDRGGRFVHLFLLGYALLIALFSRPDTFYWGYLLSPVWFAGLALVPRGVWQLGKAIICPNIIPVR